jgi:hypothetical protein
MDIDEFMQRRALIDTDEMLRGVSLPSWLSEHHGICQTCKWMPSLAAWRAGKCDQFNCGAPLIAPVPDDDWPEVIDDGT